MTSIFKTILKATVIGGLCIAVLGGGALLIAGPMRTQAVVEGVRSKVSDAIDAHIDDPVALRNKLRALEQEYPERISALRGDLAELQGQVRHLDRERAISRRVVELADQDLAAIAPKLQAASASVVSNGGQSRLSSIAFDDRIYSLDRAHAKVRQIRNTRTAHMSRAADAEHSLSYLEQQIGRFQDVLAQLETEQAQFQAQLFQLNRQVDSIERNERLIEMLADRKRTLDECTSYDITSLDQMTGKMEQILTRQEARLDVLASSEAQTDYVEAARGQLLDEAAAVQILDEGPRGAGVTLEAPLMRVVH